MPERAAVFAPNFLEDLQYWTETAPRTAARVHEIPHLHAETWQHLGAIHPLVGVELLGRPIRLVDKQAERWSGTACPAQNRDAGLTTSGHRAP